MKKWLWQRHIGIAALTVVIAITAGCSGAGGSVTVKNPPIRESAGKVELERIDRLDDLYGLAWLSADEMIGTGKPKWMEAELTVHSLVKAKDPDRPLGIEHALTVNPSPDPSMLFVSNMIDASFVRIQDGMKTGIQVNDGAYSILNGNVRGAWIGNRGYLLATVYELSVAGLDGRITPIHKLKQDEVVVKAEAVLDPSNADKFTAYYLNQDGELYRLDASFDASSKPKATAEPILIRKKVADFSAAPGGGMLAIAVESGDNRNSVILQPVNDKGQATTIAEGSLARQIVWSPDGSRLAYALFNLERGGSGLYVMDAKTGHTTLVSLYPNLQSLLAWSPDGIRLMNPEMNLTATGAKLLTEIYTFK